MPSHRIHTRAESTAAPRTPASPGWRFGRMVACLGLVLLLPSCAFLQSLAALSQVRFSLDRVSGIRLAGVHLDGIRSYSDLSLTDATRVASALSGGTLPLDLNLHVAADNPAGNPEARLLALDWTLFLQDRETVSGLLEREVRMPSGERTDVPLAVRLDLLEFFDGGAGDLVELVLSLVREDGEPVDVRLEALPTVDTPLGPIRYPEPLILGGGGTATGAAASPEGVGSMDRADGY